MFGRMLDRDEARSICSRILEQSPADATELILSSKRGGFLRLAESAPSEQCAFEDRCLQVRVEHDGRYGRASSSSFKDAGCQRALDAALAAAKVSPRLDLPPLAAASTQDTRDLDGGAHGPGLAALVAPDPEVKLAALEAPLGQVREASATATGFWESYAESSSYATSAGCFRHAAAARDWFSSTVLCGDGGAGVAHVGCVDGSQLDAERAGDAVLRALDTSLRSRAARAVEPGEYRVLLSAQAVGDLLLFMSWAGFGARAYLDRGSFLRDREGERILSPHVSIRDDCAAPELAGIAFDYEGQDRKRVDLIENGIARGPVWDRPTAIEGRDMWPDCESTGHAGPQPSASGPAAKHLVLSVDDSRQVSDAELAKQLGNGLLVTQFHYTNLIDPVRVTVTGMTRNGTFLVENGEIVAPVKNLRFTESVVDALADVVAASSERTLVSAFFGGVSSVPSLVLPRFRFTSTTDF